MKGKEALEHIEAEFLATKLELVPLAPEKKEEIVERLARLEATMKTFVIDIITGRK